MTVEIAMLLNVTLVCIIINRIYDVLKRIEKKL